MGNILNEAEHPLIQSTLPEPQQQHESNTHSLFHRTCSESKKLWHIAAPSIFTRLAMFSITVVTQSFAGHLGDLDLAAISIACTVLISITFGFLLGMASALETLCGQAYGAGQHRMLGVYLQRSWVVLFLSSILMLPMFVFATPVLKLIGQPVAVAEQAGLVAVWLIPFHLSFPFQFTLQRFLQCQLKTGIIAWVSGAALAIHVLVSWVFVYKMRIGIVGTALSIGFSWWLSVLGMLRYALFGGCPHSWTGFSAEAFVGLWEFFKLALASGVMLALENFYYRLLLIVSGYMHNTEIAIDALSVCVTIYGWESMIPLAFLGATGVRVANELGAGNAKGAKFATVVSVVNTVLVGFIFWLIIVSFNKELALIFTSSSSVIQMVNELAMLLAFTILLNCIQPVLSGVAVGSGRQAVVAYINIGSYYLVGIPLGVLLGWLLPSGIIGMWTGMMSGTVVQTLILTIITMKYDWEKEVCFTTRSILARNGMVLGGADKAMGSLKRDNEHANNLTEALLATTEAPVHAQQEDQIKEEQGFGDKLWLETKKLWLIVGPSIFSRIAAFTMNVVTQAFAGHLGDVELAAISIANTVIVGFNFGLLLGMASALETLCGQAFGAKRYHMLGIYMQRSWIVLFLCCFLLLPFYVFATPLLKFLGQPDDVAEWSGIVAVWLIPLHFSFAFQFPLQRFLQCQLKTAVIAWVSLLGLVVNVVTSWLLIYVWDFGLYGAAISLDISWWILVFGMYAYTAYGGCPLTWTGFSVEAFSGLWEFLQLSTASGVMLCLENWYYRILVLMTGQLENATIAVDALSVCMTINGWEMMIPLAFFAGTGVRVANELGAGNGKAAKFATQVSVVQSTVIGLIFCVLITIFRDYVAYIFTTSSSVLQAVDHMAFLLAVTILLNSIQPVLSVFREKDPLRKT
ncbi:TRANSPARENT TESTA protein 12 [Spatholobus suberectus]|nr:TRANSPARENT TESTA protein 12 [Spatholobus suberectus]